MTQRLALLFLAAAALLILGFSLVGGAVAAVGFALLAAAFPMALMALGASRRGRLGAAALPIGLLLAMVEVAFVVMLACRGQILEGPWIGGLPLAAAVQIYGIFLLPLAVTALGFALAFRRFGVEARDLERLRARAREGEPR